jgi:MATE family multidrug resistance protein
MKHEAPARFSGEVLALLRVALPMAAVYGGGQLMGLVDTAIVGRLGAMEQGAAGIANGVYFWLSTVGLGVMMSLEPLASQALGAKRFDRMREVLWLGFWLGLLVALVMALPIALSPGVLGWFGFEEETARNVRIYLLARLPGLLPGLWFSAARSYLQSIGNTRPLLVAIIVGNVANFFLDVLLVFGGAAISPWLSFVPAYGLFGAGIATAICTTIQLGVVLYALWPELRAVPREKRRITGADLRLTLGTGIPIGLQFAAEVGFFTLVGLMAGRFSSEVLAAHQVALSLASFSYSAALGASAAGGARVGRAVGAKDQAWTRRAGLAAFAVGLGLMGIGALLFLLIPGPLTRLVSNQPEVLAEAIPLLGVAAVFQLSDAVQGVGAGVLRGFGDTRIPFAANLIGHYGVGLPIAIFLGLFSPLGIFGLWWGLCAGLSSVAVVLFARFWVLSGRPPQTLEGSNEEAAH